MSGAADKVLLELQKRIEKTCSKHRKDEIGRICAFVGKSMETVLD